MKKIFFVFLLVILLGITSSAHAVSFDAGDIKFGINGYMDLEYTYMSEMPMTNTAGTMIMRMDDESSLDQHHMNLLFDAERGKFRAHVNLESIYAYTTAGEYTLDTDDPANHKLEGTKGKGEFSMLEAYGQYTVNDLFKVTAGHFLMPFGIYNEVKYITPLFATVVLPQMYQLPRMYTGGAFIHPTSNLMVSGDYMREKAELYYSLHIGNGERETSGLDKNKDKLIGGRLKLTLLDDIKVGVSYCTVNDSPDTDGRNNTFGADLDLTFLDNFNLQSEYILDEYDKRDTRYSYYARLTYYIDKFSPFIAYDFWRDKRDLVYKSGMNRWGAGTGYNFTENIILKGEYHYHVFSGTVKTTADDIDLSKVHMFRASAIFIF